MSIKLMSLGRVNGGFDQEGLRVFDATNATPIVLSLPSAIHGIKRGDTLIVAGVTGLTNANGEWRVSNVVSTLITLEGTIGNGTFGGTVTARQVFNTPPFIGGSDAAAFIAALDNYDGAVLIEGSADNITFNTSVKGLALPTGQDNLFIEVSLSRYMRFRSSPSAIGTVGNVTCQIISSS